MPKYEVGDLVHVKIITPKKIGSDVVHHLDGIIKKYNNEVYYVVNPKTSVWCFAREHEITKYPGYVKKSWLKKGR